MVLGDFWQFLVVLDGFLLFFGGSVWFFALLMVLCGSLWFLVVLSNFLWSLDVLRGFGFRKFLVFLVGSWWFLVFFGLSR